MNKSILAQNITNANDDQWWIDHDAYAASLSEYNAAHTTLEQALGVEKDFDKTLWTASELVADLRLNNDKYCLIGRFEEALRDMIEAKAKL